MNDDVFFDMASLAVALDAAYDTTDLRVIESKVREFRAKTTPTDDEVPPNAWECPGWADYCLRLGLDPEAEARELSREGMEGVEVMNGQVNEI